MTEEQLEVASSRADLCMPWMHILPCYGKWLYTQLERLW